MSKVTGPIQLKRGSGNILSETQKTTILAEGEPFYHKGAEFVTIGNGESMLSDLPRLGVGANISLIGAGNVSSIQVNKGFQIKMQDTPATQVSVGAVRVFGGSRNVVSLGEAISVNGGYLTAVGGGLNIGADGSQSNFSTCIGYYSSVKGGSREVTGGSVNADYQTVIGCEAVGSHRDTVAIGHGANAWNDSCIAIGGNASTDGYVSVVIGANATSNAPLSIALGKDAHTDGRDESQIAIGTGAKSYFNNCISIGTGAISGDDSIELSSRDKYSAISIGAWSKAYGTNCIAFGNGAVASGPNSYVQNHSAIAIGTGANAVGISGISIGGEATSVGNQAISIGMNSHATVNQSIAIGYNAVSSDSFLINIGSYRGSRMRVGPNTVLLGHNTGISADIPINSVAIGTDAAVASANFVQLLSNVVSNPTLKVGRRYAYLSDNLTSDARLKQNVADADTAVCLADVNRLKVSRFEYKPFVEGVVDKHRTGWMADDVEKVFKNAVYRRDDTVPELDENGEKVYEEIELEDGTKQKVEKRFVIKDVQHLDMTTIGLPTLWGAVQELSKLMTATQERITELENAVKALKKENTLLKKQVKALEDSQKSGPEIGA